MYPHSYGQSIYDKRGKNIQKGKTGSSINGAGKTADFMQNNQTGPLSPTIFKNNPQMD